MTYKAWHEAIKHILETGTTYLDGDNRRCTETRNMSITVEEPRDGVDGPYQELRDHDEWVYPSKKQLLDVVFNDTGNNSLDYTYGARLLKFDNALNQITQYVIPLLKERPKTRRAVAQVYDPRRDSSQRRTSTPGIIYVHFVRRNNALHCNCMLRSNDVFFGYPANIIQIHHIHQWVADKLKTGQGSITTVSNSAHVFHDAYQDIQNVLGITNEAPIKDQNP